jgi:hypothetical protein
LTRHQTSCSSEATSSSQKLITEFSSSRKLSIEAVRKLNNEIVVGLAKDLRPLGSVERTGFKKIAQAFINFGAVHGKQNIDDCIRHRTTLKRDYLPNLVSFKQNELKDLVSAAPQLPHLAFTSDMWSDKYKQRSFLSLSVHYIDTNWKLNSHMLAVDEFLEKDKSTISIRKECGRI